MRVVILLLLLLLVQPLPGHADVAVGRSFFPSHQVKADKLIAQIKALRAKSNSLTSSKDPVGLPARSGQGGGYGVDLYFKELNETLQEEKTLLWQSYVKQWRSKNHNAKMPPLVVLVKGAKSITLKADPKDSSKFTESTK